MHATSCRTNPLEFSGIEPSRLSPINEVDPNRRSRSDQLIADLKQNRLNPGQFRLRTLFLAFVVLSVLLATPRLVGWSYPRFFGLLWIMGFALAPLIAFIATALVPSLPVRSRIWLAVICIALTTVPVLIFAIWQGETDGIPGYLVFTSVLIWVLQIVSIGGVWYFLFRKHRE